MEVSRDLIARKKAKERFPNATLNYMQIEDEQHRATDITKKLQLYTKRNLRHSLLNRMSSSAGLVVAGSGALAAATVRPSSAGAALGALNVSDGQGSTQDPRGKSGVRIIYRDGSALALENATKGPPLLAHTTDSVQPPELTKVFHNIEKIFINRRAKEVEEKIDQMELQDTISMWQSNKARIEEETNRKQESALMSSQTGRSCFKIIRPQTAPNTSGGAGDELDLTGGSDASRPSTGAEKVNFADRERRVQIEDAAKSFSLSPYDNLLESDNKTMMLLHRSTLHEQRQHMRTPDTARAAELLSKGLAPTHPEALRSTSLLNTTLDVVSTKDTIFAPSMHAANWKTAKAVVIEEEPDPNAKNKPKPKPQAKKGKDKKDPKKEAKKKNLRKGPIDPYLMEEIFPVLSIEQEVPSMMRMKQMQQVEAIREAFAKHGLLMPTSVIEKGILTPEDRPYTECILDLPSPEMGLVSDYTKPSRAKKGKKEKKPKKEKGDKKPKK